VVKSKDGGGTATAMRTPSREMDPTLAKKVNALFSPFDIF